MSRFAIVVSRFNEEITDGLLRGAREVFSEASVRDEDLTIVRVPGAFEIPIAAQRLAESGDYDAIVCLGCLMTFGVLTTMTEEQAVERSGTGPGNKGREAAAAAMEMATLFRKLDEGIGG